VLLFFSSIFSIFIRGKYQQNRISFYLIHSGIAFILLGIFIFYSFGWKGELILDLGKEENRVKIISGNQKMKWHYLDYKIKLIKYEIDYYPTKWKLNLYLRNDKTGDYTIISSISPYERKIFVIPKTNWKYRIVNYYPDFKPEREIIEVSYDKPLNPALKIKIVSNEKEKIEWLLAKEKNIYIDENNEFQITFLWEWEKGFQKKFVFKDQPEKHLLRINVGNKEKIISVQVGRKYKWRNFSFNILKFLPHFRYDLNSRSPYSLSERPENPALLIKVEEIFSKDKGVLVWLFSRLQGLEKLSLFNDKLKLEYSYIPPKFGVKQHIVITGADKIIRFIQKRSFLIIPFEFGVKYKLNEKEIQILKMHPAVETKIKFTTRSKLPRNPAIYLILSSPFKEIPFLKESEDEPIILEGGKYILNFENGKKIIKNIKSHLKILFSENKGKDYWIDQFHPVKIGKNYLLQGSLSNSQKIKIHVSYKPGLKIFHLGFLLCLIGLLIQLLRRIK
ncbi:cytochrome c biogenesis protein ResB, partial [Candidatus Aminicenantes bacterium AH-873-B07]|nr:cytochrome c biogenesis protein ResB [Candidatus Aminicenantes bacterium AH-873-B07]